jgi:hypothetical protein
MALCDGSSIELPRMHSTVTAFMHGEHGWTPRKPHGPVNRTIRGQIDLGSMRGERDGGAASAMAARRAR